MSENEIKSAFNKLKTDSEFKPFTENIDRLKSEASPKQYTELKTLLVGASKKEGSLRERSLQYVEKKIHQLKSETSKEGKDQIEKRKNLVLQNKLYHSRSIRRRTLNKKFAKSRKVRIQLLHPTKLSPIQEGSRESESPTWRNSSSPRKTKKNKWFFGWF
jgi:hypothetical protein